MANWEKLTMPDPPYQLTPPFSSWRTGYRPPSLFGDQFKLKLDLPYLQSQLGWAFQSSLGQVYNLGLSLPGWTPGLSDSFTEACAAVARAQSIKQPVNPSALANAFGTAADSDVWDAIRDLVQDYATDRFWRDIPSNKRNIVTGDPAGAGKIDPSGKVVPTSPDGLVTGLSVPAWKPISLGKRFLFASDPDVHLYLYLDTDAYSSGKPNLLLGGGAVGLEGKTSDGTPMKLKFGAGRDSSGGGAGFFTIQIGPDPTPIPSSP
jgi:hypothetical protein